MQFGLFPCNMQLKCKAKQTKLIVSQALLLGNPCRMQLFFFSFFFFAKPHPQLVSDKKTPTGMKDLAINVVLWYSRE